MTGARLPLIRGDVTRQEAESVGCSVFRVLQVEAERELFYPYYWFLFRATWRTLLGPSGGKVSCLVDGRRRVVSTTDAFETELVSAPPASVLGASVLEPEAEARARRAAEKAAGRRQRALASPRFQILDRGLRYKRFWVVRTPGDAGARRLLVDGITAGAFPLEPAAMRA